VTWRIFLLSAGFWSTTSPSGGGYSVTPPEMERRLRSRLKPTTDSWRVDETYIRIKGKWRYLYRAVDSTGATLDFLLSAKQDAAAAKRFLAKALGQQNRPAPRVINTDGHAAYPPAIAQLKSEGTLDSGCQHRPVPYLNNVLEQDHRAIKRRVNASQGRSPSSQEQGKCQGPRRLKSSWDACLISSFRATLARSVARLRSGTGSGKSHSKRAIIVMNKFVP